MRLKENGIIEVKGKLIFRSDRLSTFDFNVN